ncbi:MAG TPA: S8 family serine peptidase [Polyangiales bacterium]|nr:S8 family serine peptidase [Polyangiales bacterium]
MKFSKANRASFFFSLFLGASACAADVESLDEVDSSSQQLDANTRSYLVTYKATSTPSSAKADVTAAGGKLVASFDKIGVVVAQSSSAAFASKLAAKSGVQSVVDTSGTAQDALTTKLPSKHGGPKPPKPSTSGEPLAAMQWNMDHIHAKEARAITPGKPGVIVGIIDSGIDDSLPDLVGQVDPSRSVSCIGGIANTARADWAHDDIGHGSHVAGIIAAKQNGVGTVGVAPGVKLAALKVTDDGFVYPEAFLCAVYWGATHGVQLANASLITDPYYYHCDSDPVQKAIKIAQQRAVTFAQSQGLTLLAAAANENQNLNAPKIDPATGNKVDNGCKLLPVELDGVIGVSALAGDRKLAFYSNYGTDGVDLAAPGGDFHVPMTGNPSGQIIGPVPSYSYYYQAASDWNGRVGVGCSDGLDPNDPSANPGTCKETYALLQGTSQAVPHVTGIAALALSKFGKLSTAGLLAKLSAGATDTACPPGVYQPYPDDMPAETCSGSTANNAFFGTGQADALATIR